MARRKKTTTTTYTKPVGPKALTKPTAALIKRAPVPKEKKVIEERVTRNVDERVKRTIKEKVKRVPGEYAYNSNPIRGSKRTSAEESAKIKQSTNQKGTPRPRDPKTGRFIPKKDAPSPQVTAFAQALKRGTDAVMAAHGEEIKDIERRAQLLARANRKIFESNKQLLKNSGSAFENNADKIANFMASFGQEMSDRLKAELQELTTISQNAVGATFEEMKELRDRSEVVKSTIEELKEIGVKGADAGTELAEQQLALLKKNTGFLKGIMGGIKKSLKEDIVGRLESISLGPIPIGRIISESYSQRVPTGQKAREIAMNRLDVLREEKGNVRSDTKNIGRKTSETFEAVAGGDMTDDMIADVVESGITPEMFLKTTDEIFEILSSIDDSVKKTTDTSKDATEIMSQDQTAARYAEHRKEETENEAKDRHEDLIEVLENIGEGTNDLGDMTKNTGAGGGILSALGMDGPGAGIAGMIGSQILGRLPIVGKALTLVSKIPLIGGSLATSAGLLLGRGAPAAIGAGTAGATGAAGAVAATSVGLKAKALSAGKAYGKFMLGTAGPFYAMTVGFYKAGQTFKETSGDIAKSSRTYLKESTSSILDVFDFMLFDLIPDDLVDKAQEKIKTGIDSLLDSIGGVLEEIVEYFEENFSLKALLQYIPFVGGAFVPDMTNGVDVAESTGVINRNNMIPGEKSQIINHDEITNKYNSKLVKDLIDLDDWNPDTEIFLQEVYDKKLKEEAAQGPTVEPPEGQSSSLPEWMLAPGSSEFGTVPVPQTKNANELGTNLMKSLATSSDSRSTNELETVTKNANELGTNLMKSLATPSWASSPGVGEFGTTGISFQSIPPTIPPVEIVKGKSSSDRLIDATTDLDVARKARKEKEKINEQRMKAKEKQTSIVNAPTSNVSNTVSVGEAFYNNDPSYTRHENKNLVG